MRLKDYYSDEGIDHLINSKFGQELEEQFQKLRKYHTVTNRHLQDSKLNDIIKHHTGLKVDITTEHGEGAYIYPPDITSNNVIINDTDRPFFEKADTDKLLKDKKFLEGVVNLKTGRVSGDYSKVEISIVVCDGLIINGSDLTVAESTSILLHEIGHAMVYLEMLGRCTKTNFIMAEGTRRLMKASTSEQRVLIYDDIEDSLGSRIPEKDKLALKAKNETAYQIIILNTAIQASEQQLDVNIYNTRSFEQLADNYASRLGYARPLATALDKIWRKHGETMPYRSSGFNIFINIMKFIGAIAGSLLIPQILLILLMSIHNPLYDEYDPPRKRILKLQHQINDALKDKTLSVEHKARLIADSKDILRLLDTMRDNIGLWETLYKFMPTGRKQAKAIAQQELMEAMLNNDLFSASVQLEL